MSNQPSQSTHKQLGLVLDIAPALANDARNPVQTRPWLEQILAVLDLESRSILSSMPLLESGDDTHIRQAHIIISVTALPTGQPPQFQLCLANGENRQARLMVDFNRGKLGYRLRHSTNVKLDLARAIGVKPGRRPAVLDLTAGLGKDAFVLASLGCRVLAVERQPVIYVILADGLRRANTNPYNSNICEQLTLVHADARDILLDARAAECESIYIDPMYPHRNKSALVKQDMRLLRDYAGDDDDAESLLIAALASQAKRIAVKRPLHAPSLGVQKPDLQYKGKSTRFDVYVMR